MQPIASRSFSNMAYGALLAIALGWILHIGQRIFIPIIFSILVVYVITGLAQLLRKLPIIGGKLTDNFNYMVSILIIIFSLIATATLIISYIGKIITLAPYYQASLLNSIQTIATKLGVENEPTWDSLRREVFNQINIQWLITSTVTSATSMIGILIVVFMYVAFLLIEKHVFPQKLANLSRNPKKVEQIKKIIEDVNKRIGTYLALKTLLSLFIGAVSWVILSLLKVELAGFWAALIILLNYIPYLGSILSVIFPTLFALIQFGEWGPVLTTLSLLSIAQFAIGNFLDPYLMGNSLNLSPFSILTSLAIWSAIWGISGAFLAVPITACLAILFAEFEGTRVIAVLLSRNGIVNYKND